MHISVLLDETIKYLNLKEDSVIVDCTLGLGGHSKEILKYIPNGYLYAFDQDKQAIKVAYERIKGSGLNFKIINSNFKNIKDYVSNADGILFDLGVSSPQLDNADRGFSFHKDAPLDMRMDKNNDLDAKEVVNTYTLEDLTKIFYTYGEEKYSKSIASSIVKYRTKKEIETTLELVEIIKKSVPSKYRKDHHPARKVFQAIRIEVNDEINVFKKALKDSLDILNPGGRICVITFHSLEDRACKEIFRSVSDIPSELKSMPVIPDAYKPKYKIIASIRPSKEEVERNPRSRSAHLRVIERV